MAEGLKSEKWQGVCLLLIDIQNDFISGSLAINEADKILPTVTRLIKKYPFQIIISSQDYHPPLHISFASSHHDTKPFHSKQLPHPVKFKADNGEMIDQMMWPDHCVQGTNGCLFHKDVQKAITERESQGAKTFIVRKGQDPKVDGYSAFSLNDYIGFTDLPRILFSQHPAIHTVVIAGLASDFCVLSSAIDAIKFNLRTILVQDGVKGVDQDKTKRAYQEMESWGVEIIQSDNDLLKIIK